MHIGNLVTVRNLLEIASDETLRAKEVKAIISTLIIFRTMKGSEEFGGIVKQLPELSNTLKQRVISSPCLYTSENRNFVDSL